MESSRFTCYYYWIFAPHRGGISDSADLAPSFSIDVATPDKKMHSLALYCDQIGAPHFARLRIHALSSEEIPDWLLPTLQIIQEHLLAVLRMTFRSDTVLAEPGVIWNFVPSGEPPNLSVTIEGHGYDQFDPEGAKNLFIHSMAIRETFRLYVDGNDARIPLQFRFLSFYKLLEMNFKEGGHWRHAAVHKLLDPFRAAFISLGHTKEPVKVLHDLRDRCAHIKTGRAQASETLGVTHLNHAAAVKVSKLLPVLRAVCATVLNDKAAGKFMLNTEIASDGFLRAPGLEPAIKGGRDS